MVSTWLFFAGSGDAFTVIVVARLMFIVVTCRSTAIGELPWMLAMIFHWPALWLPSWTLGSTVKTAVHFLVVSGPVQVVLPFAQPDAVAELAPK